MICDIHESNTAGYLPQVDFETWRVAIINTAEKFFPEGISYFEKHNETDECFVLLSGKGTLFAAEGEALEATELEHGKIYNIKKGTFHAVALGKNSSVLVIENRNTCRDNSSYKDLTAEEKMFIINNSHMG